MEKSKFNNWLFKANLHIKLERTYYTAEITSSQLMSLRPSYT